MFDLAELEQSTIDGFQSLLRQLQFGKKKQAELLRAMAGPLSVGRPRLEVADHIETFGIGKQREIAAEMSENLRAGMSFISPLKKWIDSTSYAALASSERTSPEALIQAMGLLAESLERQADSGKVFLKTNAYPFFVLIAIGVIMVVFIQPVVDQFKLLIDGAPDEQLDSFIAVINFYKYKLWFFVLLGVSMYLYALHYFRTNVGPIRDKIDKIPLFSGYRLNVGARAVATFALLKEFGMSRLDIINIFTESGGNYQRYHGDLMGENVANGVGNDAEAIDTGLLDEKHISLLKLYVRGDKSSLAGAMKAASKAIDEQLRIRSIYFARIVQIALYGAILFNLVTIIGVTFGFDIRKHQ